MKRAQIIIGLGLIFLLIALPLASAFWPFDWLFKGGFTGSAVADGSGSTSGSGSGLQVDSGQASGSGVYSSSGEAKVAVVAGNQPSAVADGSGSVSGSGSGSATSELKREKVQIKFDNNFRRTGHTLCGEIYILETIPINETLSPGKKYSFQLLRSFNDSFNKPTIEGPFKAGDKAKVFGNVDMEVLEASLAFTTISLSKECSSVKTAQPANVAGAVQTAGSVNIRSSSGSGEVVAEAKEGLITLKLLEKTKINKCGQEYTLEFEYMGSNDSSSSPPYSVVFTLESNKFAGLAGRSNIYEGRGDVYFKNSPAVVTVRVEKINYEEKTVSFSLTCGEDKANTGERAILVPDAILKKQETVRINKCEGNSYDLTFKGYTGDLSKVIIAVNRYIPRYAATMDSSEVSLSKAGETSSLFKGNNRIKIRLDNFLPNSEGVAVSLICDPEPAKPSEGIGSRISNFFKWIFGG